jgi:SnoaL-like domain
MIELADRVELHELPGRYGDAIDDRNWHGLDAIFTPDATFDKKSPKRHRCALVEKDPHLGGRKRVSCHVFEY